MFSPRGKKPTLIVLEPPVISYEPHPALRPLDPEAFFPNRSMAAFDRELGKLEDAIATVPVPERTNLGLLYNTLRSRRANLKRTLKASPNKAKALHQVRREIDTLNDEYQVMARKRKTKTKKSGTKPTPAKKLGVVGRPVYRNRTGLPAVTDVLDYRGRPHGALDASKKTSRSPRRAPEPRKVKKSTLRQKRKPSLLNSVRKSVGAFVSKFFK
jgi:hypothetical protein